MSLRFLIQEIHQALRKDSVFCVSTILALVPDEFCALDVVRLQSTLQVAHKVNLLVFLANKSDFLRIAGHAARSIYV